LHAKSDYDSVNAECSPRGCTPSAYQVRHDAHAQANTATVVTALGAAALVAGGAIWLFFGRENESGDRAQIGIGPASAFLRVPMR
jgi:hypothetical protein